MLLRVCIFICGSLAPRHTILYVRNSLIRCRISLYVLSVYIHTESPVNVSTLSTSEFIAHKHPHEWGENFSHLTREEREMWIRAKHHNHAHHLRQLELRHSSVLAQRQLMRERIDRKAGQFPHLAPNVVTPPPNIQSPPPIQQDPSQDIPYQYSMVAAHFVNNGPNLLLQQQQQQQRPMSAQITSSTMKHTLSRQLQQRPISALSTRQLSIQLDDVGVDVDSDVISQSLKDRKNFSPSPVPKVAPRPGIRPNSDILHLRYNVSPTRSGSAALSPTSLHRTHSRNICTRVAPLGSAASPVVSPSSAAAILNAGSTKLKDEREGEIHMLLREFEKQPIVRHMVLSPAERRAKLGLPTVEDDPLDAAEFGSLIGSSSVKPFVPMTDEERSKRKPPSPPRAVATVNEFRRVPKEKLHAANCERVMDTVFRGGFEQSMSVT